jgi:hypothetical protein
MHHDGVQASNPPRDGASSTVTWRAKECFARADASKSLDMTVIVPKKLYDFAIVLTIVRTMDFQVLEAQ